MIDDPTTRPSPRYFPIERGPFRMTAGLVRMGHDFGNGRVDEQFFQRDEQAAQYRIEKERILKLRPGRLQALNGESCTEFQVEVLTWMRRQLKQEHSDIGPRRLPDSHDSLIEKFKQLSLEVQEDFALIQKSGDEEDKLVLVSVCFPSGWKPETLLGAGFDRIHAPVPEFSDLANRSRQLVRAMTTRGPYVRFVWSLTADPRLDHHPEESPRDPWSSESEGYLRVERQITVPFPAFGGSLFLIRTYVYPLHQLSLVQRCILCEVTEALPPSIKTYKGFGPETLDVLKRAAAR